MKANSNTPDNNLNRLLQQWSSEQQPSTEQLNALCQRVQSSLASTDLSSSVVQAIEQEKSIERQRYSFASRVALTLLSLSAVVLICLTLWSRSTKTEDVLLAGVEQGRESSEMVEFGHQKELIEKLQSFYAEPLMWIAESSEDVVVELGVVELASDSTQPWLLIRLAVERRDMNATEGANQKPLWQIDLAVRNEQTVLLTDPANLNGQINVWPCLTDDGLVMVDTRFTSLGPVMAQGNQTNIMRPGSRTQLNSPEDPYVIWQYVELVQKVPVSKS